MTPKNPYLAAGSRTKLLIIILFAVIPLATPAALIMSADDICGEWWTPGNEGRMIFFKSQGLYYGMISWMKYSADPETGRPRTDKHNPDPSLRSRPLLNLILFSGFGFDDHKGKYTGGTVYDAQESGKTYSCWLKLVSKNVLEIHGYIGISLIGRSEYFTRVQ